LNVERNKLTGAFGGRAAVSLSPLPSGADFSVSPLLTDPGTSAFVTDVLAVAAAAAAASPFPASYKDIKKK